MRKLIHLSDLHFGKHNEGIVAKVLEHISFSEPDIVVISGDIVQYATDKEFELARNFINSIKSKVFVIPGNHDIPIYNFWKRFTKPFVAYKKYINEDMQPEFIDEEIAIFGLNTVTQFKPRSGIISQDRVDDIVKKIEKLDNNIFKIIVAHHPFCPIPKIRRKDLLWGRKRMMEKLKNNLPDLFLGGHLHQSHFGPLTGYDLPENTNVNVIFAGTGTSTRIRKENNTMNEIVIDDGKIQYTRIEI